MKRITGALAGAALAGTMGIGMATSASASSAASAAGVSASSSSSPVSCPVSYIPRGIRVTCPASIPGTAFRAVVKCQRPNGVTFMKKDVWRVQGTGYSQAQCPIGTKKVYYPYAFEYK